MSGILDDVAGTTVQLSVWARDGGSPRRECVAPAPLLINVKPARTPPQAFFQTSYTANLYLPTFPGVRVLCVGQSDLRKQNPSRLDASDQQLNYTVLDGDESQRFAFDNKNRCLYVRDQLNLRPHYNLTLQATDDTFVSSATAEVFVQDAPLSTLSFSQDKYWANVYENSTKEMNVVVMGVKGQPLNHHVRYSILNPNDNFEIRPTAGVIKTTGKPFDREEKDHYVLVVQVGDISR